MPETENVYCDIENRIIYLQDDIAPNTIGKVNNSILYIINSDNENEKVTDNFIRKPIKLYINSNGGGVQDTCSLLSIMKASKTPIYTYCTGYAYSSAFLVFIAGHKRYVGKYAELMYHQIMFSDGDYVKYQETTETQLNHAYRQKQWEDFVAEHTAITKETLIDVRERKLDYCITPENAIKFRCADEIINQI